MKGLLKTLLLASLLSSSNGCATSSKETRPHLAGMSGAHLATGGLTYIYPVPPTQAHKAMEAVLQEMFAISYRRKQEKRDMEQFNIFGEMGTDFRYYEENGKKYRKKCDAKVYAIPKHPEYSEAYLRCILDVYELGLIHGRGGIHNLFTQWWDWYPEHGLYVAEDLLELIAQKLKLKEGQVIRLNQKDFYTREEILELINTVQEKKRERRD